MSPLRTVRWWTVVVVLLLAPAQVRAQQAPEALSLTEAIALARQHNPDYLAQRNNEDVAEWAVREAYGAFLPSASANFGLQYQAEGSQRLGIFTGSDLGLGASQSYYLSDYSLGLGYSVSGATFFQLPQEKAARDATQLRTVAARYALESMVTQQYIAALAAADAVALAEAELQRADENLRLASARVAVGDAIPLESKQAEVERGRAEVELLKARNQLSTQRLRLVQQIGLEIEGDVVLTTELGVFEPRWAKADLIETALARNPELRAQVATERASVASVRMARSAYFPTVDLSLGWAGYTREAGNEAALVAQAEGQAWSQWEQCGLWNQISDRLRSPLDGFPIDCSELLLTDRQRSLIVNRNRVFPFDFTSQPLTAQMRVSLPIFTGFTRQRQVEEAQALADDATYRARAESLRVKADVAAAYDALETAYLTLQLEERNVELADEQLRLARERYRVGMTSFVDLIEAETLKARADRSYLTALYTFHESLAALEAAVGAPLRPEEAAR